MSSDSPPATPERIFQLIQTLERSLSETENELDRAREQIAQRDARIAKLERKLGIHRQSGDSPEKG